MLIDIDADIKNHSYWFFAYTIIKIVSYIKKKILIITNKCYNAINISNIFLAFKYVKHYHLGQMLKSTFQSNLRIKIMNKDSNFKNKMIISISIKNRIL